MSEVLFFHRVYWEAVTVAEGIRLGIRLIQPTDKQKLVDSFQRLSAESRYSRFLTYKKVLTPAELRFFTEFDGVNHMAIGAFELATAGAESALVGVARFIRLPDATEIAEASLVVTDDRQGLGIGHLLLGRLLAAAAERGVRYFLGYLLAENHRVRRLISHVCGEATFHQDGSVMTVKFPVLNLTCSRRTPPVKSVQKVREAVRQAKALRRAIKKTTSEPLQAALSTFTGTVWENEGSTSGS